MYLDIKKGISYNFLDVFDHPFLRMYIISRISREFVSKALL